jgi:DNA-binding FrmR family transcriptional regulator
LTKQAENVRIFLYYGGGVYLNMLKSVKQNVLSRLKSIEGHIKGIIKMVEEERYCIDLLKQLSAVQAALDKVNAQVLEGHMKTCVSDAIRDNSGEEVINELMETLKYMRKL